MAKRHWRSWNYKEVTEPTADASANNVTRNGGRRFAEKAAGVEEIEKLPLRQLSLDAERPRITLQQVGLRCAWLSAYTLIVREHIIWYA